MISDLDQIQWRLERAHSHIEEFTEVASRFIESDPYTLIRQKNSQEGEQIVVEVEVELTRDVPPELGVLASEVVHHLRASIDNAIWAIGQKHGCSEWISFPVAKQPEKFPLSPSFDLRQRGARKLQDEFLKLPKEVGAIVERVQPYHRVDDSERAPLWMLDRMWNDDKHRLLVVSSGVPWAKFDSPIKWGDRLVGTGFGRLAAAHRIKGERQVMTTRMGRLLFPEPQPNLKLHLTAQISFGPTSPVRLGPADLWLGEFYRFTKEEVIDELEPFLV